jgi:mannose-1-phosphate guanylyltransferase
VLDPALLERLPAGASDSVRDLYVPLLAEGARLQGLRCAGAWYDFGRPALYRDAQLRLLRRFGRRRVLVGSGARVAATAGLRTSVVGARSRVGAGARVERSVLWEEARVEEGARVARAIVTTGAVVRAGERAEDVIVMPLVALGADAALVERHADMAWVAIQ